MIQDNLVFLRKQNHMSQEMVAEQIGVTRQALAKWEKGVSEPDLGHCVLLAKLYDVTVDDLINYEDAATIHPKGKYLFGTVTVGERGQIVIPKKARDVFQIHSGSKILMLGDKEQGIALVPESMVQGMLELLFNKGGEENGEE